MTVRRANRWHGLLAAANDRCLACAVFLSPSDVALGSTLCLDSDQPEFHQDVLLIGLQLTEAKC